MDERSKRNLAPMRSMLLPAAPQREKVEIEKTVSQRARTLIMHVLKCCN